MRPETALSLWRARARFALVRSSTRYDIEVEARVAAGGEGHAAGGTDDGALDAQQLLDGIIQWDMSVLSCVVAVAEDGFSIGWCAEGRCDGAADSGTGASGGSSRCVHSGLAGSGALGLRSMRQGRARLRFLRLLLGVLGEGLLGCRSAASSDPDGQGCPSPLLTSRGGDRRRSGPDARAGPGRGEDGAADPVARGLSRARCPARDRAAAPSRRGRAPRRSGAGKAPCSTGAG